MYICNTIYYKLYVHAIVIIPLFYFHFQSVEVFDKENFIPEEDDEVVTATSSDVALINSDNALVSVKEKSTQEKVSIRSSK